MSESQYRAVVRLLPRMRRFAYGLSGSMERAEDLVQEAVARLLDGAGDKGAYLDRWLFRTIRNLHVDGIRSQRVVERYRHRLIPTTETRQDSERKFEVLMSLEQVRRLIERLPVEQREVLLLIGIEGFSYREASDILSLPMGTVTSRLARARRQLLQWVAQEAEDAIDGTESKDG